MSHVFSLKNWKTLPFERFQYVNYFLKINCNIKIWPNVVTSKSVFESIFFNEPTIWWANYLQIIMKNLLFTDRLKKNSDSVILGCITGPAIYINTHNKCKQNFQMIPNKVSDQTFFPLIKKWMIANFLIDSILIHRYQLRDTVFCNKTYRFFTTVKYILGKCSSYFLSFVLIFL